MTVGWAFFSFYPITVFPILEAPQWRKGFTVNVVLTVAFWFLFMVGQYLWKRDQKLNRVITVDDEDEQKPEKHENVHVESVNKS